MGKNILIIEDNRELAQLLELHLRDLSFKVDISLDGVSGVTKAEANKYDLIILDIMLPGLDGLEICRRLRSKSSFVPILMLTSKSSEMDRVIGLELGADDYVTKPFSIVELMARVKAIMRRVDSMKKPENEGVTDNIFAGDMVIDIERRIVTLNRTPVDVTMKEFDLLLHFARLINVVPKPKRTPVFIPIECANSFENFTFLISLNVTMLPSCWSCNVSSIRNELSFVFLIVIYVRTHNVKETNINNAPARFLLLY